MSGGAPSIPPALDPSKPTQFDRKEHKSYGGQSLFVPLNVWGSQTLHLAVGCMPRENYAASPLPPIPANAEYNADGSRGSAQQVTTLSQQYDVRRKFQEKMEAEAQMYPYRYCAVVSDEQLHPKLMVDNPQLGLTPDRAAAVVRNMRRTLFSNALREMTIYEGAGHDPLPTLPPPTLKSAATDITVPKGCYSSVVMHVGGFDDTTTTLPAVVSRAFAAAPPTPAATASAATASASAPSGEAKAEAKAVALPPIGGAMKWLYSSVVPWGFFQSGATLMGSERWTVQRCAQATPIVYRVNYFRGSDGNTYFTKVVPTTVGGVFEFLKLKFRGTL